MGNWNGLGILAGWFACVKFVIRAGKGFGKGVGWFIAFCSLGRFELGRKETGTFYCSRVLEKLMKWYTGRVANTKLYTNS